MQYFFNCFSTFLLVDLHFEGSKAQIFDLMIDDCGLVSSLLRLKFEYFLVLPGRNRLDDDLNKRELLADGPLNCYSERLIFLLIMLRSCVVARTVYAKEPLFQR
jgi:hypothetical protein